MSKDRTKLDITKIYKHGPECMLEELPCLELLYVGNSLIVYRDIDTYHEYAVSLSYWLNYACIIEDKQARIEREKSYQRSN